MSPNREEGAISPEKTPGALKETDVKLPSPRWAALAVTRQSKQMAQTRLILKTVSVLLCLCLLAGQAGAGVCAKKNPGIQVVLVLDLVSNQPASQPPEPLPQAAHLLVHLLQDQDYLGITSTGEPQRVALPVGELSPEQRSKALSTLAGLVPRTQPLPSAEVVGQVLTMFKADGPQKRLVFILSDQTGDTAHQQQSPNLEGVEKVAAQARDAGVAVYAASLGSKTAAAELPTLARATGGRVWEEKTVFDLQRAILNFYQRVKQPQEVPLTGHEFRLDPWVRQAVVAAARSDPGQGVMLTNPRGERLTLETASKTVRWLPSQGYDLVNISQPRPGVWSLAGARPEDSRVFLATDVILDNAEAPPEVGADEAFLVTAALSAPKGISGEAQFRAEFQVNNAPPMSIGMHVPEPGQGLSLPPGLRLGRVPPLHQEGEGTLKIFAQGRAFQRLLRLPITVAPPWYRPVAAKTEAGGEPLIRFQPELSRVPEGMGGTAAWQSAQGSLAGVFINPAPGSEIVMARPTGVHNLSLADLHLKGSAPGGRPLEIASGPCRFMSAQNVPDEPTGATQPAALEKKPQDGEPTSLPHRPKRRWFWLAVCGFGIAVLLGCGFILIRERLAGEYEDDDSGEGAPSKNVLRLRAQVEALTKEKVQLQTALEEKTLQFNQLMAEKGTLESEMGRFREKFQGSNKNLEELEKKLEDAEREAKGVQEEYMALYARNQKEKEGFQKK